MRSSPLRIGNAMPPCRPTLVGSFSRMKPWSPARRPAKSGGPAPTPSPGSPVPLSTASSALARSNSPKSRPCSRQARRRELAVVAHGPEMSELAPERPGYRLKEARRRLVEAVGFGEGPRHAVLDLEAGGVALALGAQAGDQHRQRTAHRHHHDARQVRVGSGRRPTGTRPEPRSRGRALPPLWSGGPSRPWQRSVVRPRAARRAPRCRRGGIDGQHHAHRGQCKQNRPAVASRVPRSQVRAQLGRGYCATKATVPIDDTDPQGVQRIRAANPSPLTLDGTNSYVVGGWIVDPGPADPSHLEAVRSAVNGSIEGVVLTHSHADHAEGAEFF